MASLRQNFTNQNMFMYEGIQNITHIYRHSIHLENSEEVIP